MNKILISIVILLSSQLTFSYDMSLITKEWQKNPFELYLNAKEAYDMKTANPDKVLLLDVRNQAELHYTGMPDSADANVPYRFDSSNWKLKKNKKHITFKMPKNPNFVEAVENVLNDKNLTKESSVIIMCATGSRAPFATRLLHKAGFKKVYAQMEGFEGPKSKEEGPNKGKRVVKGWKVSNLPWSYDLIPEKMYYNFDPIERAEKKEKLTKGKAES